MNKYWTIKEAAEAWGVSYRTAERYVKILRGDSRRRIPAGTPPPAVRRGNPNFRNPAKQAEYSRVRWAGLLTPQEHMQIAAVMNDGRDAALRAAVRQAEELLPRDDPEAAANWLPYPVSEDKLE